MNLENNDSVHAVRLSIRVTLASSDIRKLAAFLRQSLSLILCSCEYERFLFGGKGYPTGMTFSHSNHRNE